MNLARMEARENYRHGARGFQWTEQNTEPPQRPAQPSSPGQQKLRKKRQIPSSQRESYSTVSTATSFGFPTPSAPRPTTGSMNPPPRTLRKNNNRQRSGPPAPFSPPPQAGAPTPSRQQYHYPPPGHAIYDRGLPALPERHSGAQPHDGHGSPSSYALGPPLVGSSYTNNPEYEPNYIQTAPSTYSVSSGPQTQAYVHNPQPQSFASQGLNYAPGTPQSHISYHQFPEGSSVQPSHAAPAPPDASSALAQPQIDHRYAGTSQEQLGDIHYANPAEQGLAFSDYPKMAEVQVYDASPHQIPQNFEDPRFRNGAMSTGANVDALLAEATGVGFLPVAKKRTPRTQQSGHRNLKFSNSFRFTLKPHWYQKRTDGDKSKTFNYKDPVGRVSSFFGLDVARYNRSDDGSLVPLMVQATNEIYRNGGGSHNWNRTFIRNVGPIQMRIANWPYKTIPPEASSWSSEERVMLCLRWIPAMLALSLVLTWPGRIGVSLSNFGDYPSFPYRNWRYPKLSRNAIEDKKDLSQLQGPQDQEKALISKLRYEREGLLRPECLCFLTPDDPTDPISVGEDAWWNQQPENANCQNPPYIFIAYTAEQFGNPEEAREMLWKIGELAAKSEGLKAFWVGCSCFHNKETMDKAVYGINDIIRGAHQLVVALKQSHPETRVEELREQWGERKWTLPEALLSPNDKDIKECICYADGRSLELTVIPKRDIPLYYWRDSLVARQLVDHYLNTLSLSRLELITLAIRCLETRKTTEHSPGDDSYILMGLLRRRPEPVPEDTKFEAFARLSLLQDSDRLLERMMCLCPKVTDEDWLISTDAWGANLWDIHPLCQVSSLHYNDTVVLDGCYTAAIKWDRFERVGYLRGESLRRRVARILLRLSPFFLIIGAALIGTKFSPPAGATLLLFAIPTLMASPYLLRVIYGGKLWRRQAKLFGFEGYMDTATIEAHIFGYSDKRLRWSPYGSILSRHSMTRDSYETGFGEADKEFEGIDPITDPKVRAFVEAAQRSPLGKHKVFTIVDTNTMMVSLIAAIYPPVTLLVCGKEGGMIRAALCSYEWETGTLYRESVLRMETPTLDRMSRCSRVRFGFKRPPYGQSRPLLGPRHAVGPGGVPVIQS